MYTRAIRVLHCPTTVGGNAQGLALAERELGLDSISVTFRQNYLNYPAEEVLFGADDNPLVCELKRYRFFRRVLRDFDIIHFNFGESIFPTHYPFRYLTRYLEHSSSVSLLRSVYGRLMETRDLNILRESGKGIVVTYQGDDARQGDFQRERFEISMATEVDKNYYSPHTDEAKRRRIARFACYAHRIYALNPDLLHVLPDSAEFMPYANVDPRKWLPASTANQVPVVLFAGTNPVAKGWRFISAALERLRRESVPFEFVKVENVSWEKTRSIYEQADILVDQLLAGWYGGLAVELMALGKPVISYIRESDLKFIPQEMRKDLPIISAAPATIYSVLKEWLTVRRDELPKVGQSSRAYVEKWHDPVKIAARLKSEYEAILANRKSRRERSKTQGSLR
jgi:glycosyltransferase involved in cell wall biosynthesis